MFANRIYQILRGEFDGVGAGEPGQRAHGHAEDRPSDASTSSRSPRAWAYRAVRSTNADEFNKALAEAVAEPGPRLIEVQM